MNVDVETVVGGGLVLLALAYAAAFVALLSVRLGVPRAATSFLYMLCLVLAATALGTGLAVLLGGTGPLGFTTGQWASAFVVGQLVGIWAFIAIVSLAPRGAHTERRRR